MNRSLTAVTITPIQGSVAADCWIDFVLGGSLDVELPTTEPCPRTSSNLLQAQATSSINGYGDFAGRGVPLGVDRPTCPRARIPADPGTQPPR
jgi:hypothetical protein